MKVLIVEDHALLGKSLKRGMEEQGWTVDLAAGGDEGWFCASSCDYNVIVLDWMLPQLSGLEILNKLRSSQRHVPTIMITAKGALTDRVEGLDCGADDYLVKPFDIVELIARVRAVYRRSLGSGSSQLSVGSLTLDLAAHRAFVQGTVLDLTAKEYDLLAALVAHLGQMIRRDTLAGLLYALDSEPESNSLDVLLGRLRRKLAGGDVEIATIRGKGFLLRVAEVNA